MFRSWSEKLTKRRPSEASGTLVGAPSAQYHPSGNSEHPLRRPLVNDDKVTTTESERIIQPSAVMLHAGVSKSNPVSTAAATTKTPYQQLCDELKQENADSRRLKNLLKSSLFRGQVPSELRFATWKRLLGVSDEPDADALLTKAIQDCERDLPNQRVIRVDVERTRVDLPEFREPPAQEFLTQLLTYFCKTRQCRYKQGLNEVLAPFVYLLTQRRADEPDIFCKPGTEGLVYRMWTTFMDRFIPHLYDDDRPGEGEEMITLQCSFRFFELLLLYHDPELWHLLDHNKLKPELYASPWLMTMFAQNIPMFQAFQLWETMLLGDGILGDAYVILFVALAFLCSNRNTFLTADPSDLPVLLTSRLSYHRRTGQNLAPPTGTVFFPSGGDRSDSGSSNLVLLSETLKHAINIGNELRKHTPDLLLWDIRTALHVKASPPTLKMLSRLTMRVSATCSPEFFWMGITGKLEDSTEIIVIDCRSRKEFEQKRPRARLVFNFGMEILENPEELQASLADLRRHILNESALSPRTSNVPSSLSKAWRWHICVIGTVCRSLFDTNETSPNTSPAQTLPVRSASSATISPPTSPGSGVASPATIYPPLASSILLDSSLVSIGASNSLLSSPRSGLSSAPSTKDIDGVSGMCLLHLLKHSFPCVCVVEGGWEKVLAACPDPNKLLFPLPPPAAPKEEIVDQSPSSSLSPSQNSQTAVGKKSHPAYRRPRASYGDAVEDFDGPSFIVSRSSRGAPIKF